MEAVDVRGRFVWHQLMTRDVNAAKQFYSKLIGWNAQAWPPDPSYTICTANDVPVAGMMAIPPEMPGDVPPHWLHYIGTRDVDGTAAKAQRAGGTVMKPPSDMQGAGRYAVIRDPQGAVFAILDPENIRPEQMGVPPLGTFGWHELATTDNEAAFAFYRELFGWDVMQRMDMGPSGTYLIFGWKGAQRGGIYKPDPARPMPPNWLGYSHVLNADQGFAAAKSAGAQEMLAPMDVPGGSRIAVMTDPTGAHFAILSMPPAMPAVAAEVAAAKPKAKDKVKAKPKAKAKAKSKAKAKPKAKAKTKAKMRKSAPRKKAVKRKPRPAKRKPKPARRKK